MNSPADAGARAAIELRYGQYGLLQARLRSTDPGLLLDELTGRVASAPQFFQATALCLDLGALAETPDAAAIRAVMEAVKRAGLLTVGLTEGSPQVVELGKTLNLPVLSGFRAAATPRVVETKPANAVGLIQSQPVRSGQRVYARDRDLTVVAMVGAGAEVIADGSVHVYGALRGRAMAGVRGDTAARIFCQEFRAELVAIAGVFRVFESLPTDIAGQSVQVWLADDVLHIARLGG
ncbi:septum site-determining protein MinC [bacterium]|nr:MAG: septum site-determining protein MinC [bacterium]